MADLVDAGRVLQHSWRPRRADGLAAPEAKASGRRVQHDVARNRGADNLQLLLTARPAAGAPWGEIARHWLGHF